MHYRDKKGKFKSKKSYYKDLKAQEAKINLATHRVDDAVKEDHSYCKDKPPNPDLSDLGLGASVDVHQTCQFKPIPDDSWKSGRRIVELDVLAKRMFCASCNTPLHLSNIESERRYGLGSILFIRCQNNVCWALNDVKTGKRSQGAFDVNSKLALAVVHTGLGPVQVNNLLTTLNPPPVDPTTLKRWEYKIDSTLGTIANMSCNEAEKEEIEMGNGKVLIKTKIISEHKSQRHGFENDFNLFNIVKFVEVHKLHMFFYLKQKLI
nr:uncharacterized protein LOC117690347 isoform X2 [Crassostrea gigas]